MAEIHLSIDKQVARLCLDNAKKHNALTWRMLEQLETHIAAIEANRHIRVAVLEAAPAKSFCAGAAIDEWSALHADDFAMRWVKEGHRIFDRLTRLSVPSIAILEAPVFGGGLELVAAVDWRIFSPNVTFALPETSIGIIPGWSGTQRLARLIPEPQLRAMVLLGKSLSAVDAQNCGFGQISDHPTVAAQTLIQETISRAPSANKIAKMMINAAVGENRDAMIEALGGGMAAAHEEKFTGVSAFLAKKKAIF